MIVQEELRLVAFDRGKQRVAFPNIEGFGASAIGGQQWAPGICQRVGDKSCLMAVYGPADEISIAVVLVADLIFFRLDRF